MWFSVRFPALPRVSAESNRRYTVAMSRDAFVPACFREYVATECPHTARPSGIPRLSELIHRSNVPGGYKANESRNPRATRSIHEAGCKSSCLGRKEIFGRH